MAKKDINAELLKKEIEKYFQGLWPGMETAEQCNTDMHFTPPAIMRLANHFYELGKQNKEPVSEDLEEEIKRYVASLPESATVDPFEGHPTLEDVARHFAEWQKEQMIRDCSVQASYEAEIEKAEERGYNLYKEQMLKNAVEGLICATITGTDAISFLSPLPKELTAGDKVKIVIIPEKEDKK